MKTRMCFLLALALPFGAGADTIVPPPVVLIRIPRSPAGRAVLYSLYETGLAGHERFHGPRDLRRHTISPAEIAKVRELLGTLPRAPHEDFPRKVFASRHRGGSVEVTLLDAREKRGLLRLAYDRRRVPAQLEHVINLLGGLPPEFRDSVTFSREEHQRSEKAKAGPYHLYYAKDGDDEFVLVGKDKSHLLSKSWAGTQLYLDGYPFFRFERKPDGSVANLRLQIRDQNGKCILTMRDQEADGQWDFRVDHLRRKKSLWRDGHWVDWDEVMVQMDGEWVERKKSPPSGGR